MKYKLAKILLALGIGLSLVSCAKKPEEPRPSQVKKEEKVKIGEMTGVAQMNGYFIKMTMPDLLSVYTPKQEGLDISGKLEGGRILKYDLHSDDRTYITRISIDCDYRNTAKETADVLNAGFEDEADQYKAFTIGKYLGYKKTTVYDSSDKTYYKMLIDYPVGEDNVVLQIYVEQEGVNDLDEVTLAVLDNIVVEICMEEQVIRVKRNKLLTGFLVLGLGLSLVACSSNEPEEKVEEKKIEETKAIEEKEEKVKEEKKEEEKAKAAEEEKEKDSTIISYANKKVRVTLPKDLTSFHTPAREISRYSYMEESNVLGYSLYAKDRTFTIHFSIGTDGWDSAEAASISHNKVCKDESKMYEPCTVGEYSGYKYVVSSDKSIEYHYVLDYLVDGQDVVLTIREELRDDDDTSLLEPLLLDVVHNLKIELIGE